MPFQNGDWSTLWHGLPSDLQIYVISKVCRKLWEEEKRNYWIEITNKENTFSPDNLSIIHGEGTYYLPVRTKHGYRYGTHYWECTPVNCEYSCFNTYIGVCTEIIGSNLPIGYSSDGWALKGHQGELLNGRASLGRAKNTFNNNNAVGVLLDMDNYTLDFFIDKKHVLSYKNPDWKGKTIYPAASLIVNPEEMRIRFDVKCPEKPKTEQ